MPLLLDLTPLRASVEFRRLWWGLGVANFGSQLTLVAVGLQVYAISGSTLSVGILGICALVPLIALGLYGGALLDTYDRRTVALLSAIGLFLVTAALAIQGWLHIDSVLVLYILVGLQSAAFAINNPARTAIIPRLLKPAMLPAANVLTTTAWSSALVLGPLIGATLVAVSGFAAAYTVDMIMFTAGLWALWRLPPLPPEKSLDHPERKRGFAAVAEGLRYLASRRNVRMTFVVDLIAMIFAMPRVLWPAVGVVFLGGGATTTGLLNAAFAVGAVLAALFSGGLVGARWQGRLICLAITIYGLSVAAFGGVLLVVGPTSPRAVLVTALIGAMSFLAIAGGADAVSAVFRQTILQTATPDSMRGRLQGVFIVVVAGGPRLGDLVLGAGASWLNEGLAALAGGLICVILLSLVSLTQRGFLAYDARNPTP
jgi:Transmembrane secretion effector